MNELSETVSFLVSKETKSRLVAQASLERRSQAMIARIALEAYLNHTEEDQSSEDATDANPKN